MMSVAVRPRMSSQLESAAYRVRLYGELKQDADGLYRAPVRGKFWTITPIEMKRLAELRVVRIDRIGQSTFAVAL